MTVEDIEEAILRLPPAELDKFRAWFAEFEAGRVNKKSEPQDTARRLGASPVVRSRTSANACASRRFARRRFALPVVTRRGICELPKPTEVAFTVQWLVLDGRALWLARPPANHRLSPTESRFGHGLNESFATHSRRKRTDGRDLCSSALCSDAPFADL